MRISAMPQFSSRIIYVETDPSQRGLACLNLQGKKIANNKTEHDVVSAWSLHTLSTALNASNDIKDTFVITNYNLSGYGKEPNGNTIVSKALEAGVPADHIAYCTAWEQNDLTPGFKVFEKATPAFSFQAILDWIKKPTA